MGRALLVLLILGVCASGGAGLYTHRLLSRLSPGGGSLASLAEKPFGGKQKVFLLVLGVDEKNRLLKKDERRADTVILAKLDLEQKSVAALSLPRDTRVRIAGASDARRPMAVRPTHPGREHYEKLNAAHTYGGPELVRQTVGELVGIPVDRYIRTDVGGFRAIVDLIGPIEMDVEKRMDYDDNWGNLHIHLKPGRQPMDGEKAMEYVRFRHDATGDLGRMQRQRKFLRAVARKMLTLGSLPRLPQVVDQGMRYAKTDLSARELIAVARLFGDVPVSQIATATLPGTPRCINRVSYVVPDEQRMPGVLKKLFFSTTQAPRASVDVLNGNGLSGIANEAARRLARAGIQVSRTGNADNYNYEKTVVKVPEGRQSDARRVAGALGISDPVIAASTPPKHGPPQEPRMVVVLGKDYRP